MVSRRDMLLTLAATGAAAVHPPGRESGTPVRIL